MQKLTVIEAMQLLAKTLKKPCMYISFDITDVSDGFDEVIKAAPYIKIEGDSNDAQMVLDGVGIIVFENEQQMDRIFNSTVGDDGPTTLNPYDGPAKVYALTCDANGKLLNENT